MADSMERIKLMVTIVDREKTARAAEIYAAAGAVLHYATPGLGTANSDLLDYLGLGETGKSVIFSLVPEGRAIGLLRTAKEALNLSRPGKGILFTMPLSGVGRMVAQTLQTTGIPVPEQEEPMQKGNGRLIVAVVASGHTDTVMDAAKAAGARGGTILHGRRLDCHQDGGERKLTRLGRDREAADDHGVGHLVKLLERDAQQKRQRKPEQLFGWFAFGKVGSQWGFLLSENSRSKQAVPIEGAVPRRARTKPGRSICAPGGHTNRFPVSNHPAELGGLMKIAASCNFLLHAQRAFNRRTAAV